MEDSKLMDLMDTAERLEAVAAALEDSAAKLAEKAQHNDEKSEALGPIVATAASERELELERKLAAAEQRIVELNAAAAPPAAPAHLGRKTLSAGTTAMLAKQGVSVEAAGVDGTTLQAAALDTALASLSIEQRFAVKAELLRTGALA